jgi:hypothetical protein
MTTHAEAAAALRQVADQLDACSGTFGGVFVIIPPADPMVLVDAISTTSNPNPAVFWSAVEGQVGLAIAEMKAGMQTQGGGRSWR